MGEGVLVSMPEFALLHRACEVDFVQLVLLAYELCGAYALDRSGLAGALRCQQLTSSTRLARFLENVGSVRGGERLGRALRHVVDRSASPGETASVVLACLPRSMGGYGLPLPLMNGRVEVPVKMRELVGRGDFFCDALWPEASYALEYDGACFHSDVTSVGRDRLRENRLTALGVGVTYIDKDILFHAGRFDKAVRQIARGIGYRLHTESFDTAWFHRRDALRQRVLACLFGTREAGDGALG